MHLDKLSIYNFRNIQQVDLSGFCAFNFIHGINGSGKTSILESIHTLALSRSFRSRKMESVISYGFDALTVRGEIAGDNKKANTVIGVSRPKKGSVVVKLNGEKLSTVGELAGVLPVQVINPASFELLEGSPSVRRQYLDWGVFHVKHSGFYEFWPRYRKALLQRNSLLRRGNIEACQLAPWDRELAVMAAYIQEERKKHFELLEQAFNPIYARLLKLSGVDDGASSMPPLSMVMHAGWKVDEIDFEEHLKNNLTSDLRAGFTRSGPHRADIEFKIGRLPAGDVLSRGQIKTLVCALKLAQSKVLLDQGVSTVFLVDDLAAELDQYRCMAVFAELVSLGVQVFASSVKRSDLNDDWCKGKGLKRFHVEHGSIAEC